MSLRWTDWAAWVLLPIVVLVAAAGCDSSKPPKQTGAASQLSAVEKEYFEVAGGFLATLNTEDTRVAVTMAGAPTGKSTLEMIREEIKRAKSVQSTAFYGKYKLIDIPEGFEVIDRKIQEAYRLHDAAYAEYLDYWKDSDTGHIERGTNILERAALLTNECIDDLDSLMRAASH